MNGQSLVNLQEKDFGYVNRKPHMDQTLLRQLIDWGTSKQFNLKDL
jgi:hypothetical protein